MHSNEGNFSHASPSWLNPSVMRRAAMWLLASGVAAIAAIVSYSHIYALARAHGGSGAAARLLPLSVDMLILVGELMLLHEADAKGRRFPLGWLLVWSGILATLAANVTYGAQFGVLGAVIWGWPAYSFILAAAGMVAVVKRAAAAPVPAGSGRDEPDELPTTEEALRVLLDTAKQRDIAKILGVSRYRVQALARQVADPAERGRGRETAPLVPAASPNGNGSGPHG